MRPKSLKSLWWLPVLSLLLVVGGVYAAEHPTEHPSAVRPAAPAVSTEALAAAITNYIGNDAKLKGGYFLVWDAKQRKPLALALIRVHRDKLAKVAPGLYFACTDLRDLDGTVYDLDFFLKPTRAGLQVTEITIHKQAGKPRYNWVQRGGSWVRQPVGGRV